MRAVPLTVLPLLAVCLGGCGYAWQAPANPPDPNGGYMAERRPMPSSEGRDRDGDALRWNAARCTTQPPAAGTAAAPRNMRLSPGDLVRVSVPGEEAPHGTYKVDTTGTISLDRLGEIQVANRSAAEVEAELSRLLVARGHFRPGFARVSVKVLDRGSARVWVSGAVFQPGQVLINRRGADDRDALRDSAAGDHAPGRTVGAALAGASGVRPDADIAHVLVTSGGQRRVVDMTGQMEGGGGEDPPLADGDRIEVPSRGCFQIALARPSPITPPGVRVFFSNLTSPASNNAGAAVGREATSLPYGTRLLQALASGNCIGGIQMTNADRWAVLVSTNPMTGTTEVVERRIEALVRRADRDAYNPVILPGDAIACYDSAVTNYRDVMRVLLEPVTGVLRPL